MQPEAPSHLARNLAALSTIDPALSALIEKSAPNQSLAFRPAKSGAIVPVLRENAGDQPFHSLVDPAREAERLTKSLGETGYLVCLGLGGGYVPAAFLRQPSACAVLIVEKDVSTLKSLFANLPLSPVLSDSRVLLRAGAAELRSALLSSYVPAICGNLASLPVRPWCEAEHRFFDKAAEELRLAAEEAQADYGVQALFGKRWFTNMLLNLPSMARASGEGALVALARGERAPSAWPQARVAHVTAAGPSLECSLEELAERSHESIIIATDTSLPALMKAGVPPEIVVSLDCQAYSYHHFLTGFPAATTFFFDLASPPFLVRRAGAQSRFFASAHPFARLASERVGHLPVVDTTGGNVTHAAVSLARALGVPEVRLHGADFSYPRAKPYARGTYLFEHFLERSQRSSPIESSLTSFVFACPGLTAEREAAGIRYSTPVLRDYRARLSKLIQRTAQPPGAANPPGAAQPSDAAQPDRFEDAPAQRGWSEFLSDYGEALRALPDPAAPLGRYFYGLSAERKKLWATILPIAARIQRDAKGTENGAACLQESRQWALDRVDRMTSFGARA
ncbi:MAG: 6-hydroxymethylpterin diphosphokinase MptE-like protein [Spirochaetia bacterium]